MLDYWDELTGTKATILERSPTVYRRKVTQCPFKTGYDDISDWSVTFFNLMGNTINPKATLERSKGICAGDPYCEYVWKLEESTKLKGPVEPIAKIVEIPWKLKHDFALRGWGTNHRGHLYALREIYGAKEALEMYERFCQMGDRAKNLTNRIREIFKIKGNDVETWAQWWNIYFELVGIDYTILEQSKTLWRAKITKCPWKTEHKDISKWDLILPTMIATCINPKGIADWAKSRCAGDPYCEYVFKIEE